MDIFNTITDPWLYFLSGLFFIIGITIVTQINSGSNTTLSQKGSRQVAATVFIMSGFVIVFFTLGRYFGYAKVCGIYK